MKRNNVPSGSWCTTRPDRTKESARQQNNRTAFSTGVCEGVVEGKGWRRWIVPQTGFPRLCCRSECCSRCGQNQRGTPQEHTENRLQPGSGPVRNLTNTTKDLRRQQSGSARGTFCFSVEGSPLSRLEGRFTVLPPVLPPVLLSGAGGRRVRAGRLHCSK